MREKVLLRTEASTSAPINGSVEILRILGSWGIVWFHVHAFGMSLAYSGLPLFAVLMLAFVTRAPIETPAAMKQSIRRRVGRLLVPWVIWSVVYGVAKTLQAVVLGTAITDEFSWWMIYTGTSIHLWFLPYAFLACTFASVVNAMLTQHRRRVAFGCMLVLLPLVSVASGIGVLECDLPIPFPQWLFVVPASLVGICLGFQAREQSAWTISGVLLGLMAALLLIWMAGLGSLVVPWGMGCLVAILGWTMPLQSTPTIAFIGKLAWPIYLVHPLIIPVVKSILGQQVQAELLGGAAIIGSTLYASAHVWATQYYQELKRIQAAKPASQTA